MVTERIKDAHNHVTTGPYTNQQKMGECLRDDCETTQGDHFPGLLNINIFINNVKIYKY